MNKEDFIKKYYSIALEAGKRFNINPTVILAQAAHESAWGTSYSARIRKNFFGITAYGSTNEFWKGDKSASTANPKLVFRIYPSEKDSFMDFARLISSKYKDAAQVSTDTAAYAKAISQSAYISEENGDNRQDYLKAITSNSKLIDKLKTLYSQEIAPRKKPILGGLFALLIASIAIYNRKKLIKFLSRK